MVPVDFLHSRLYHSLTCHECLKAGSKTCGEGPHFVLFILSVCLSSREFTFRSSNVNIACSTATSLSPLMEKVSFYCTFVYRESRKVYKVKKVRKTVLGLRVLNSTLEDLEDLSVKCMCRLLFSHCLSSYSSSNFILALV